MIACAENIPKMRIACSAFRRSYKRQGDFRQATATRERILTDTRYAVGNGYVCQATAITERRRTDTRYTVGDYHAR